MEKRLRSSLETSAEQFLSSATKSNWKTVKPSLKTLIWQLSASSDLISSLPLALHNSITRSIDSVKQLRGSDGVPSPHTSPPTKRPRKSTRQNKQDKEAEEEEGRLHSKRDSLIRSLEVYSHIASLCLSHPSKLFSQLLPSVQALHDNLLLFDSDPVLLAEIAKLCEDWWKEQLPGKETLISQSLPFLLSKSLTFGKKVDVHRVYSIRKAFSLFDFDDDSIEDLKHLLLRTVIDPLYLKMDDGRRFVVFLFGLSGQLLKEILALIRSQIPFGRKSVLEAYADIVFHAWKVAPGLSKEDIENGFLQGLVEGAVYASSETLAASVRRVLGGFVTQRTVAGVEKLLFRLTEPVIFRSLQVANSNVRKNALHLLLDMFPLEDPDATKEVKDALIDRQFFLLERLLLDECPDVRVVAVEGSCRILFLFWEIIPSPTITKTITKIVDDMSHDVCTEVRRSTLNGITYLHGNPQTHEVLKVLVPRLGHLLLDSALSVRVAIMDLLLCLSDINTFQFHKVVGLDGLLSSLSNDHASVAQKITRLLIPSYFPSNVSPEEACNRCITLIRRSPMAGARLCEFALIEGSPPNFLMELVRASVNLVVSPGDLNPNQIEGLLMASAHLCNSLVSEPSYKTSLKKLFSGQKLRQLLLAGVTKHAQTAIFNIAFSISPDDVVGLTRECMGMIQNCEGLSVNMEMQEVVRPVHKLMLSCGKFDEVFVALTNLLQKAATECHIKFRTEMSEQSMQGVKHKKAKLSMKSSVKSKNVKGNKATTRNGTTNFQKHYVIAAGAAWQIKDLLSFADSRDAMLKSPKLEVAFSALKLISEVSIEQCMHLEYMDTSPVLAYTAIALHAKLHDADPSRKKDLGANKSNKSEATRSILKGNALEKALNHLFGCTKRLFTESESGDLPQKCNSSSADGGSTCDKTCMLNMVKMVTEILKFIVDASTVCPVTDNQGKCLQFASACLQVIIPTLRKHSEDQLQFNEDLKGTLLCLKSSFTYSAKLLNVVLNDNDDSSLPLQEGFDLANNLLNLLMSIESYFGSRNAVCFIPAVKAWVLDIVLALGSSHLMRTVPYDNDDSATIYHGTSSYLPWLQALGELELSEIDAEAGISSSPNNYPVFKEVMEMVVLILRRNLKVLDSVGVILLAGLMMLLEREECGLVFGIVHFVCVKLVPEPDEWGDLPAMLAALQELYPRIKSSINDSRSNEEKQMLESAEALVGRFVANSCA